MTQVNIYHEHQLDNSVNEWLREHVKGVNYRVGF